MKVAVLATDSQWKEINNGTGNIVFYRVDGFADIKADSEAAFLLNDQLSYDLTTITIPLLVNAVSVTLTDMNASKNVLRINGWNGFLTRPAWEIAGPLDERIRELLTAMGKELIRVPDEPGFVSARVLAMQIINEAYLALQDKVGTQEDIDLAMKLGTGYPYGPFEWASIIGLENIYQLLQKLSQQDKRYLPAILLKSATHP